MISAASEVDLYNQLQNVNLELLGCKAIDEGKASALGMSLKRVKTRDLIQLFMHLEHMQDASVPMLEALADIRDTTENSRLRDIMSEVYRDVNEGTSLSEALAKHPKIFGNIYISLISAGEETGDLSKSYKQLVKYLKWKDDMAVKIKKATRYPMIVSVVVTGAVVFLMAVIVPQILGFIDNMSKTMNMEIPWMTTSLMVTSEFFVNWWWAVLLTPVVVAFITLTFMRLSESFRYRVHLALVNMPICGPLIRKVNIARFAQTFGALFASGVDVIKGLKAARATVGNLALSEALENVQTYVQTGSPLSEALNASGEFPSMVIRMVKIGEESGGLTKVLDQVGEFYTRDVDEAVQALIALIEPLLTMILALILLWIAAGVFGPIYLNLGNFM